MIRYQGQSDSKGGGFLPNWLRRILTKTKVSRLKTGPKDKALPKKGVWGGFLKFGQGESLFLRTDFLNVYHSCYCIIISIYEESLQLEPLHGEKISIKVASMCSQTHFQKNCNQRPIFYVKGEYYLFKLKHRQYIQHSWGTLFHLFAAAACSSFLCVEGWVSDFKGRGFSRTSKVMWQMVHEEAWPNAYSHIKRCFFKHELCWHLHMIMSMAFHLPMLLCCSPTLVIHWTRKNAGSHLE